MEHLNLLLLILSSMCSLVYLISMRFVCTYCQVCPIFLSSLVSDEKGNICMLSAELIVLKDVFDIELYLYW